MSILRQIIKETAAAGATGAHAIAGGASGSGNSQTGLKSQSAGMNKRTIQNSIKSYSRIEKKKKRKARITEGWQSRLAEMIEDEFDAADVESKLNAAEKRSRMDDDTVPFGMEDEEGNIVKVYVRSDQADDFEAALGSALAGEDEDWEDDKWGQTAKEIAEVLFMLKDKFDIVDVEWPEIEGDEEEEQEMAAGEAGMDFEGGDEEGGDLDSLSGEDDGEGGDEFDLDMEGDGEDLEGLGDDLEGDMEAAGGAEGTLQDVIDMMRADAEARKADAEARTKEAEARAAEANASAAASKVEQEEQILDMEAFEKDQKAQKGEAERLAKLAKYQHQMASKDKVKSEEEEEDLKATHEKGMISKDELATMIQKYLAAAN